MCNKCVHVELLVKQFFQKLQYKTKAINKYFVANYPVKCINRNKNYVRNYIIYDLDQVTLPFKQQLLTYIDNI